MCITSWSSTIFSCYMHSINTYSTPAAPGAFSALNHCFRKSFSFESVINCVHYSNDSRNVSVHWHPNEFKHLKMNNSDYIFIYWLYWIITAEEMSLILSGLKSILFIFNIMTINSVFNLLRLKKQNKNITFFQSINNIWNFHFSMFNFISRN